MKRTVLFLTLTLVTLFAIACGSDDNSVGPPQCTSCGPSTRSSVLTNIEYAYNNRKITTYDKLLDNNFTFYLAPNDVGNGMPESWDRSTELLISNRLFDKNYAALPCQSISMHINQSGLNWTEIDVSGEAWYSASLYYTFKFEINPNVYISDTGSQAEFVVRNAGTAEEPDWKLVELRDLGASSVFNAVARATEPTTWGQVKVMYK